MRTALVCVALIALAGCGWAKGERGPMGPPGPAGSAGAQGPKGDTGPAGAQGEQGAQGAQGEKGDTGERGAAGIAGPQGEKGDTGPQGEKGDTGEPGPAGPQGPQGEKGDTGAQGSAGARGPQGPAGPQGDSGDAPPSRPVDPDEEEEEEEEEQDPPPPPEDPPPLGWWADRIAHDTSIVLPAPMLNNETLTMTGVAPAFTGTWEGPIVGTIVPTRPDLSEPRIKLTLSSVRGYVALRAEVSVLYTERPGSPTSVRYGASYYTARVNSDGTFDTFPSESVKQGNPTGINGAFYGTGHEIVQGHVITQHVYGIYKAEQE